MEFVEQSIQTYSGLSTETKPTVGAGNKVPNGSRFREFNPVTETCKTYYYNISDDRWYLSTEETQTIAGASPIIDLRALDLFEQILTTLKKIERHQSFATDTELKDQDV